MSQSERERALHRANCLASDLDVVHAIKVDHGKAYINMDLLADALAALDTPQEPATAAPPDVPQTKEQRELEFNKIVAAPRTHTNPSQRLPAVIYGRYLAGESVAHLAWDYGIPEEQVQWGIRIGHMLAAAPRPALSPDALTTKELMEFVEKIVADDSCEDWDAEHAFRPIGFSEREAEMLRKLQAIYRVVHSHNTEAKCYHVHGDWRKEAVDAVRPPAPREGA